MRCWWLPLLNACLWPLVRLPSSWLWWLSGVLSWWLGSSVLRDRREIARVNLELCFPEFAAPARTQLLDATMHAAMMGLFDSLRAWYAPAPTLRSMATIIGLEHLEDARRRGCGVILLSAHMTSITLATRLLNEALETRVWIMKRPHNNACLEAEVDRRRRSYCQHTLDKRDVSALLKALAEGHAVSVAADQDFNLQHEFLPFFGVPAATLLAIPSLARRSQATVLPLWVRRESDGRYTLRIDAPWNDYGLGDDQADTLRHMSALEAWVRQSPEQYLWVHRRFKTRPPGEAGFY